MKILIVDDKEENLYLLDSLLKGCGYEVVSAVNGFDALEKLRSDNFNMIISDILMPVMDGYSLLKKVRADNKIKDIPFVFYTATYTDGQDEELALDLGVDKYIRKPIEPEEFINIIKGVIIDAEKGKKRPPTPTLKDEKEVLKLYSERLVKKLEKKMLELEEEVTERKSLEEKLIAERDEFHSILQELPVGVAVLDAEDKFVYINSITIKIDGYKVDPDSLIGKNVKSIHSKHILSIIEDVLKDFKSGKKSHFSREAKRGKRLIEISYHAIRNGAGEYQGLTRLVSDITEKKLSEKKLRESLEYSQNLIDSSLDMIIAVDIKRQITEFNQSAEDTFGYKRDEVLGKHINMLYADVKQGLKIHNKVVEKGRYLQEIANKRKNGDIFPTLLAASTLVDSKGELIGVMGVSRDITKRKKVEEEREQALQEAQNANEVKNLFLANMSHEIRTPLNTILGFTSLIEESTRHIIGEEEKKFFNVISTSGERLMHTVHEILDISQLEAGTYVMTKEDINLVSEVQGLVDGMQIMAKEKQLILEFHSTHKQVLIRADRDGISKSISNLIDNAIKYTEKGKITVDLRQKSKSAILTIQDTGIGISQEYLDKIFEVFSQESEGYTKKYQGIGLGMAIVSRHMDLNQVDIAIESTQGKGTTITLTFPNPNEISYQQTEAKKSKQDEGLS